MFHRLHISAARRTVGRSGQADSMVEQVEAGAVTEPAQRAVSLTVGRPAVGGRGGRGFDKPKMGTRGVCCPALQP